MKKPAQILCDTCNKDLAEESAYPHSYGVTLKPEDFHPAPGTGGFEVLMHPKIDRDYHFCDLFCLAEWAGVQGAQRQLAK